MTGELLQIESLSVTVFSGNRHIPLLADVTFALDAGKVIAVVGESGAGKSTLALAIAGLLGRGVKITGGRVLFEGIDLVSAPARQIRSLLGSRIGMIFQDPLNGLHPFFTIGYQMEEQIMLHLRSSKKQARQHAVELLNTLGVADAVYRMGQYPHQLSGGIRQRVMIAMAVSCSPRLLIADEATSALDATMQIQVLKLLVECQRSRNMAMLFITHDLRIASAIADRIIIVYGGRLVEEVAAQPFSPRHPYTRALAGALPSGARLSGLRPLPGRPPQPGSLSPNRCPFLERCPDAVDDCHHKFPPEAKSPEGRKLCWLA
jgi:oligopeptide/dipeptide ABC transporter ATP-binding protein